MFCRKSRLAAWMPKPGANWRRSPLPAPRLTIPRFPNGWRDNWPEQGEPEPPRRRSFAGTLRQKLRYGENPHQQAAFYVTGDKRFGVATAQQLQGKELSYNNINDTDAAYELVAEFGAAKPACVIVKHANPCGVAVGDSLADAYRKALACDPVSAFGGVLAFNQTIDADTAQEIAKLFTEVIIAPDADAEAVRILSAKKNLRLLTAGGLPDPRAPDWLVRSVAGGLLVQNRDNSPITARISARGDATRRRQSRKLPICCSRSPWSST